MEIHKPKPIHGWREFLLEIFVIVLGISIALGAEQIVENIHWQHKLHEAEAAMRLELQDDDLPQANMRIAVARCLDDRLTEIETKIQSGTDRNQLAALLETYDMNGLSWDSEAWNVTVAGDIGAHASAEQMIRWSLPYRLMPRLNALNADEYATLPELRTIRYGRGPLTAAEEERIIAAVEKLRALNLAILDFAAGVINHSVHNGVEPSPEISADYVARARAQFGDCVMEPKNAMEAIQHGTLIKK